MLAMLTPNKKRLPLLKNFIAWWVDGLRAPFASRPSENIVIESFEDQTDLSCVTHNGSEPINTDELNELRNSSYRRKIYLSVPDALAISLPIPISKRTLTVSEAADLLMPFDVDEIWCCGARQGSQILAVPRDEMRPLIEACQRQGITLQGIAFADYPEVHYVDFTRLDSVSELEPLSKRRIGPLALVGLLSLAIGFAGSFWWQQQSKQQAQLIAQLERNASYDGEFPLPNLSSLLASNEGLSALESRRYLAEVVTTLPNDAAAHQAILTTNDLLLDMHAQSSSLVRTQADDSVLFRRSQFVSAVTTDARRDEERFRLKLELTDSVESDRLEVRGND